MLRVMFSVGVVLFPPWCNARSGAHPDNAIAGGVSPWVFATPVEFLPPANETSISSICGLRRHGYTQRHRLAVGVFVAFKHVPGGVPTSDCMVIATHLCE